VDWSVLAFAHDQKPLLTLWELPCLQMSGAVVFSSRSCPILRSMVTCTWTSSLEREVAPDCLMVV